MLYALDIVLCHVRVTNILSHSQSVLSVTLFMVPLDGVSINRVKCINFLFLIFLYPEVMKISYYPNVCI